MTDFLDFEVKGEYLYGAVSGLSKVLYYYIACDENGEQKSYYKVYDITTSVSYEVEKPIDYEECAFIAGDMIFYANDSDINYLSFLKI